MTTEERQALRRERVLETFQLDPLVPITLKGTKYTLEMNNWAVKGIFKTTGLNIMSAGFGPAQMQDPEILGAILMWGLLTHHPDLTQEAVDKLYTYRHYAYVLACLTTACDLFLPDMTDAEMAEARAKMEAQAAAPADGDDEDPTAKLTESGSATGLRVVGSA